MQAASSLPFWLILFALLFASAASQSSSSNPSAKRKPEQIETNDISTSTITLTLEHALVPNSFKPRGQISFQTGNLLLLSDTNRISSSIHFSQSELSSSDVDQLKELIRNDRPYQVRVRLPFVKDSNKISYVMSSVPACALVTSEFADSIKLHLDLFGNVVAVDYKTTSSECYELQGYYGDSVKFSTKVRLSFGNEGEKPMRIEEIAQPKEEDNRGFFAKYWYFILPVVLLLVVANMQAPADDSGANAAQNANGAASAPSAPASGRRK